MLNKKLIIIFFIIFTIGIISVFSITNMVNNVFNNETNNQLNNESAFKSNITDNITYENNAKDTKKSSKVKSNPHKTTNKNNVLTKKEAYVLAKKTLYTSNKYHISYEKAKFVYNDQDFQYYEFPVYEKSTGDLEGYVCVDIKTKHVWSWETYLQPID